MAVSTPDASNSAPTDGVGTLSEASLPDIQGDFLRFAFEGT
jgi:hypothetical protein